MAEIIAALIALYGVLQRYKVPEIGRLTRGQLLNECTLTAIRWAVGFLCVIYSWGALRAALDLPVVPDWALRFWTREELSVAPFIDYAVIVASRCFYHYLRTNPEKPLSSAYWDWRLRRLWWNLTVNIVLLLVIVAYYVVTRGML